MNGRQPPYQPPAREPPPFISNEQFQRDLMMMALSDPAYADPRSFSTDHVGYRGYRRGQRGRGDWRGRGRGVGGRGGSGGVTQSNPTPQADNKPEAGEIDKSSEEDDSDGDDDRTQCKLCNVTFSKESMFWVHARSIGHMQRAIEANNLKKEKKKNEAPDASPVSTSGAASKSDQQSEKEDSSKENCQKELDDSKPPPQQDDGSSASSEKHLPKNVEKLRENKKESQQQASPDKISKDPVQRAKADLPPEKGSNEKEGEVQKSNAEGKSDAQIVPSADKAASEKGSNEKEREVQKSNAEGKPDTKTVPSADKAISERGFNEKEGEVQKSNAEGKPDTKTVPNADKAATEKGDNDTKDSSNDPQPEVPEQEPESDDKKDEEDTDWKYCKICDQNFEQKGAYWVHTRGIAHCNNALEQEKKRNPEASKPPDPAESKRSKGNIQVSSLGVCNVGFYCELCDMSFINERSLINHDSSKIHLRNVDRASGIDPDKKEPTEFTQTEFPTSLPDVSNHGNTNMLPPGIVPHSDPTVKKFFCKICDITASGIKSIEAHVKGQKHQKKLRTRKDLERAKEVEAQLNADHEGFMAGVSTKKKKKQRIAAIQVDIDKCKEPLVGLDYMTEYQSESSFAEPQYICDLCEVKMDKRQFLIHTAGLKHRMKYFKFHSPRDYELLYSKMRKNEKSKLAHHLAKVVEEVEGRHKVRLKIERKPMKSQYLMAAAMAGQPPPDDLSLPSEWEEVDIAGVRDKANLPGLSHFQHLDRFREEVPGEEQEEFDDGRPPQRPVPGYDLLAARDDDYRPPPQNPYHRPDLPFRRATVFRSSYDYDYPPYDRRGPEPEHPPSQANVIDYGHGNMSHGPSDYQDDGPNDYDNGFGDYAGEMSMQPEPSNSPPPPSAVGEGQVPPDLMKILTSMCEVDNEHDAELALKVSNALTKALLEFRMKSLPAAGDLNTLVKEKLAELSEKAQSIPIAKKDQHPSPVASPSAEPSSRRDGFGSPGTPRSILKKRPPSQADTSQQPTVSKRPYIPEQSDVVKRPQFAEHSDVSERPYSSDHSNVTKRPYSAEHHDVSERPDVSKRPKNPDRSKPANSALNKLTQYDEYDSRSDSETPPPPPPPPRPPPQETPPPRPPSSKRPHTATPKQKSGVRLQTPQTNYSPYQQSPVSTGEPATYDNRPNSSVYQGNIAAPQNGNPGYTPSVSSQQSSANPPVGQMIIEGYYQGATSVSESSGGIYNLSSVNYPTQPTQPHIYQGTMAASAPAQSQTPASVSQAAPGYYTTGQAAQTAQPQYTQPTHSQYGQQAAPQASYHSAQSQPQPSENVYSTSSIQQQPQPSQAVYSTGSVQQQPEWGQPQSQHPAQPATYAQQAVSAGQTQTAGAPRSQYPAVTVASSRQPATQQLVPGSPASQAQATASYTQEQYAAYLAYRKRYLEYYYAQMAGQGKSTAVAAAPVGAGAPAAPQQQPQAPAETPQPPQEPAPPLPSEPPPSAPPPPTSPEPKAKRLKKK